MAKKKRNTPMPQSTNTFDKGLITDVNDYHMPNRAWTHARNAINNSHTGDLGDVGNEPANKFCASAPYDIIGSIHLEKSLWCIFSGNDIDSEIGTFDADKCEYTRIVNDPCLGFRRTHLISGASRPTHDCSFNVYWQDNLSVDRAMDLGDVPWIQDCIDTNGCIECTDTDVLDCDKIRLESLIQQPCVTLERGPAGGNVLNGSYYVQISYLVNSQRVTDYFPQSNVLHLFDHGGVNTSIDVHLENLDTNFEEYELVIVQFIAEKFSARRIGAYSTHQTKVTIDNVDETLPAIDPKFLILSNPIADTSEGIFSVGKYLFRTGITGKFDFNYQPLANQITAKWQVVEYPKYYYRDGGSNVGHMRDEVYPYFVRFVYGTGDKSNSYHIPGRGPRPYLTPDGSGTLNEDADYLNVNDNNIEQLQGLTPKVFEMFNTATATPANIILPDGGEITAEGEMGYWESSEIYPDDTPEIWNSDVQGRPDLDLCGQPIRHHKFPENTVYDGNGTSDVTNHYTDDGERIRILAVAFDNIQPPVDNQGNLIPNIVGYEILRGSRDGNKTVLYKGMINNMREYDIPPTVSSRQGLYPNYPFNSLDPDPFNSTTETSFETIGGLTDYDPNPNFSRKHHTFHSPDTMFNRPFLGEKELKIYGAMYGDAECEYIEPNKHPKHVFITDLAFYVGIAIGIGTAIAKSVGTVSTKRQAPSYYSYPVVIGTGSATVPGLNAAGYGIWQGGESLINGADTLNEQITALTETLTGVNATQIASDLADDAAAALNVVPGTGVTMYGLEITTEGRSQIPPVLKFFQNFPLFVSNTSEGADLTYDIIRNISKPRQFARQFIAYCGYENFAIPSVTNKRRLIQDANYLEPHLQNYGITHRVNNLLRDKTVAFDVTADVEDLTGTLKDQTFSNVKMTDLSDPENPQFTKRASSHYAAFKTRLRNQYGQIDSIRQLVATQCVVDLINTSSGTIFGGDTYIGRYQEKNTFYHFQQWLYDQPNFTEFNYHNYDTVQHTAFWMDTDPFDTHDFVNSIGQAFTDLINSIGSGSAAQNFFNALVTPSDLHCFDRGNNTGLFTLRNVWMYLFHSSVRDFFVESELNIDHRDHDEAVATRHWDALQDLRQMFDTQFIKAGNFYKLDRSLHVSRMPFSKLTWGTVQDRDYSPLKAETCYTDYPLRLTYSLPQQTQLKADNWRVFLANNYKDFTSKVTAIKAIRSTGIMLLFENESPGIYPGVDELQLKSGTSITVGDGGLFFREMQRLDNSDKEFEYGSCQSRRGTVNTPAGLFYLSQEQGKAFIGGNGLKEFTLKNNQHWFNQYLPYQLLLDFPDYDILDNPVAGIGCQATYDNEWGIVYFAKRDFRAKPEYVNVMEYIGNGQFRVDGIVTVETGDPRYFNDASWTISYDPKNKEELAWHDWHPGLMMGGPNSFFTTKGSTIWEHNKRCDLYCNFYGVDYPFEIEFQLDNLPAVTTVRSIEYFLQVFEYSENCRDRFHNLDFNFDEAIIHNSEQVSGVLRLNLAPKNDVSLLVQYPIVGLNQIDILYSKEEQRYRFNQFWDIVRDRGEFSPTVNDTIWITEPNGYIRNLNPVNIDYQKSEFQRKKFRHNNNRVLLRRTVCGNKKMILLLSNTKLQNSPR
jgi:hypothetical protein